MGVIDCHVHGRDFNEAYKETVEHLLLVAKDSGVDAVFDVLNTNPSGIDEETIVKRIRLAEQANIPEVFYGMYVIVTKDLQQVKHAVALHKKYFPKVVGLKMFAGHSTNNLGVIEELEQYLVFETLAQENYCGVLAIHPEKESEMRHSNFNHAYPFTHCLARPEESELASVKDMLDFAEITHFPGKLHFFHISAYRSIGLINDAKKKNRNVSCGVTPHHLLFDWTAMQQKDGLLLKMNPPLRSPENPPKLLEYLRAGDIDWIETDHAPHTLNEKTNEKYLSGISNLEHWPLFMEYLRRNNFNEQRIKEITRTNILGRFGIDVPESHRTIKDHRGDYPFNVYASLEKELGFHY